MPDPQVLYIVTAVVVAGLVAWVAVVLTRGAKHAPATAPALTREAAVAAGGGTLPAPAPKVDDPSSPAMKTVPAPAPVHAKPKDDVPVDIEEEEEPTGPMALILVTAVGRTDPGLKRKHNEDAYTILEDHHLFVIADGMGRHAAGEVASQLCVDAITEAFQKSDFAHEPDRTLPRRGNRIRSAILLANERIYLAAQENDSYAGMGTTVVSAYFSPNNQRVYIAHVGDSRCYRCRDGKLTQITTDHTLGAAGIQGKSAAVLSRAVGVEENVEVDVAMESPLPGDIYLLCSDGLSRMVNNDEILTTLTSTADLEAATKKLVDMANERGGRDNITIILVRVDDAKRPSVAPRG